MSQTGQSRREEQTAGVGLARREKGVQGAGGQSKRLGRNTGNRGKARKKGTGEMVKTGHRRADR